jgi:hypothetical protein
MMTVGVETTQAVAAQPAHELALVRADTFWARALGCLGERELSPARALWLKPCWCVHTFGMRFSIGVFFIDESGAIVKTLAQLDPNRMALCWRATSVIETAAFAYSQTNTMKVAVMQALARAQSSQTPTRSLDKSCSTAPRRQ